MLKGGWENGKRERKQYDRRAFYFLIVAFLGYLAGAFAEERVLVGHL